MSTSGSYSFAIQTNDIIREAMLNIGKLGEAESPTSQEFTDCQRKLNMIAKQWMAKQDFAPGLKMWKRRHGDLILSSSRFAYNLGPSGDNWAVSVAASAQPGVASLQGQLTANAAINATTITVGTTNILNITAGDFVVIQLNTGDIYSTTVSTVNNGAGTFTIPATGIPSASSTGNYVFNYTTKGQRPEVIETVLLRDNSGSDVPCRLLTLQDYEYLSSKQQPGFLSDPAAIYYESQLGSGVLYLDVFGAQDTSKRLHITYFEPVQDFVNTTDNPDYPQRWYLPLCWGLTKQIAPMFNLPFTKDMQDNLNDALAIARELDSDKDNIFFQPGIDV
ncbi:MAG TPA: hypothetical protein VNZ86_07540 [Bacteroidia bacterium]|jgi:hypothetical protein|nr:hypothetical protein [Bacteroidia bacterium]